jgi:hypothetical protein
VPVAQVAQTQNSKTNKIMMTIYFKNGMTKQVSKETVEIINKRMLEGCAKFQIFSDKNENLFLIINLEEIIYIN